jgi:drug/metabolite transporter (DMT)-like permease
MSYFMTTLGTLSAQPRARAIPVGIICGLAAGASFSMSGALAKALIAAGWSAGSAVTARVLVAAAVLLIPALLALRGRWHLLRENVRFLIAYGAIAVAGCQLTYFLAVDRMQVGVAILIEFTSPLAVLAWMWLRHGQRPTPLTFGGALLAIAGLALILDLLSGADLDGLGVTWALISMLCAAFYWVVSANASNGLPPIVLAGGGLLFGGVTLAVAGLVGVLEMSASTSDVRLAGADVPWWIAIAALGMVTAALAYVLGITATRLLGSRLASFVGLSEAVCGVLMAWLLLAEAPRPIQLAGGALILAGVVAVRLGEPRESED